MNPGFLSPVSLKVPGGTGTMKNRSFTECWLSGRSDNGMVSEAKEELYMAVRMIPRTMVGATLPGNSTVEMKEFEVPKPGHGEVLIRTKATTICGSDIRCIYREHTGKGARGVYPGDGCRP